MNKVAFSRGVACGFVRNDYRTTLLRCYKNGIAPYRPCKYPRSKFSVFRGLKSVNGYTHDTPSGLFSVKWLAQPEPDPRLLSPWPVARIPNWVKRVNDPLSEKEIDAVRWSIKRGSPFGDETWVESIARRFGLESTLRPRGRPRVRPFRCYFLTN